MRQFSFGSAAQFEELWTRLSAAPKVIRYNVTLKPNVTALLAFDSLTGGGRVRVKMERSDGADRYRGESEFVRSLVGGTETLFSSADQMRERFAETRCDYENEARAAAGAPVERKHWKSAVVDPAELSAQLKERVIGQDEQIDGIVKSVCNHLRKKKPRRPLTIMLPGPTGVGKSETAKSLAELLQARFGKEQMPLININCNEYRERHRISQFLGSPAGYVGYDDACVMEPIKYTDSVIVLFDEFEKAHGDIHTAVMTWLDSGIVTLAKIKEGETSAEFDCAPSIIVMTSNINMKRKKRRAIGIRTASDDAPSCEETAFEKNDRCRRVMVENGFKPEIAGRISYFFEYSPLSAESVRKILGLAFKRKASEYGAIISEISDELQADMFERFGRSAFGVRPFEYALDDILGKAIPPIEDKEKTFAASGTLEALRFEEVTGETAGV